MGIVVFDLEGVLIDNKRRFREALRLVDPKAKSLEDLRGSKRGQFWKLFMDSELAKEMDEVNFKALELWRKKMREGHKLVVLSGTKKEIALLLIEKLKKKAEEKGFEFKPFMVIWRPSGDKRKSSEFKKQKIRDLEKLVGDEVIEIHDDDPDVVNALRQLGYNTILWVDLKPQSYQLEK